MCCKGFRLNSTRLAHEKRHSGNRPHICDTCGRSFSMPEHLRRHMKTHENKLDRLVSCPFCKKKIFAGRNMRKHLVRHRELNLTEIQAKAISSSLKPDREMNERDGSEEEQRPNLTSIANKPTVRQPIRCVECNDEVKSVRKLIDHLSDVHYQRELTALERKEIRLRHGVQKLHHCQFCSSSFIDYRLLRSHVLAEHLEHAEDLGFSVKGGLRNQGGLRNHKCPSCSLFFHLRAALDEHIVLEHLTTIVETNRNEPLLQFRCWYCALHFQTPEEVVTHMTHQHESLDMLSKRVEMADGTDENNVSSSGLWACPHCPINVKTEDEYTTHLALHVTSMASSNTLPTSSTILRPENVTDETSPYLNALNSSADCVVKKYLTTDEQPPEQIPCDDVTFKLGNSRSPVNAVSHEEAMATPETPPTDVITLPTPTPTTNIDTAVDFTESSSVVSSKEVSEKENLDTFVLTKPDSFPQPLDSLGISIGLESNVDVSNRPKKTKKKKLKHKSKKKHKTRKSKSAGFSSTSTMESCRFCSDVFQDKTEMNDHIQVAHANEDGSTVPFRCWFCTVSFSCPEDAVAHMTNEHDNLDNLSRRIEMTELKNQIAAEKNNCKLKLLKRSADASLSPVNNLRCPQCPKTLGSKEAYELHIMVHEASHNTDLLKSGSELLNRSRIIDRSSVPSNPVDDVSLTGIWIFNSHPL